MDGGGEADDYEQPMITEFRSYRNSQAAMAAASNFSTICEPEYVHLPRNRPDLFKMTEFVQDMIDLANSTIQYVYPEDADEPFDIHAQKANPQTQYPTKQTVIQELRNVMSAANATKSLMNDVIGVLHRSTGLNLPVKVNPRTKNLIHHWSKECCYEGKGSCKNGADCSPFTTTHTERTPKAVMSYRSIIIKLLELYKKSLDKMPEMFTYNETRVKMEGLLTDILDGSVPVQHLKEMKLRFLDRKEQYARDNGGAILHELSLCLSAFYDGDKLYQRSSDSLWPYLISIMNCDPCFRTTLGLGLFMAFMHNMPMGSGAEQSVIDDMLTPELEQLFDGILFEFTLPTGERHAVFIQARLIFLHLDTRAADKVWHISSAGGMCGCTYCDDCKGLSRPIIDRRVYPGASLFLPKDHILKFIGEYKGYEPGYFGEDGEVVNAAIGKELSKTARSIKIRGRGGDADDSEFNEITGEETTSAVAADEDAPRPNRTRFTHPRSTALGDKIWLNNDFPWKDVAPACWTPFDDPETRGFTRVLHEEYLGNARRHSEVCGA
eukprot:gene22270-28384_t